VQFSLRAVCVRLCSASGRARRSTWSPTAGGLRGSAESVERRLAGLTTRLSGERDRSRCTNEHTPHAD